LYENLDDVNFTCSPADIERNKLLNKKLFYKCERNSSDINDGLFKSRSYLYIKNKNRINEFTKFINLIRLKDFEDKIKIDTDFCKYIVYNKFSNEMNVKKKYQYLLNEYLADKMKNNTNLKPEHNEENNVLLEDSYEWDEEYSDFDYDEPI
jgi:hypothetical protein